MRIDAAPDRMIVGRAASDVVHLMAELIDNALSYSPPGSPVTIQAAEDERQGRDRDHRQRARHGRRRARPGERVAQERRRGHHRHRPPDGPVRGQPPGGGARPQGQAPSQHQRWRHHRLDHPAERRSWSPTRPWSTSRSWTLPSRPRSRRAGRRRGARGGVRPLPRAHRGGHRGRDRSSSPPARCSRPRTRPSRRCRSACSLPTRRVPLSEPPPRRWRCPAATTRPATIDEPAAVHEEPQEPSNVVSPVFGGLRHEEPVGEQTSEEEPVAESCLVRRDRRSRGDAGARRGAGGPRDRRGRTTRSSPSATTSRTPRWPSPSGSPSPMSDEQDEQQDQEQGDEQDDVRSDPARRRRRVRSGVRPAGRGRRDRPDRPVGRQPARYAGCGRPRRRRLRPPRRSSPGAGGHGRTSGSHGVREPHRGPGPAHDPPAAVRDPGGVRARRRPRPGRTAR